MTFLDAGAPHSDSSGYLECSVHAAFTRWLHGRRCQGVERAPVHTLVVARDCARASLASVSLSPSPNNPRSAYSVVSRERITTAHVC